MFLAFLLACADKEPVVAVEPLDLPADPAARGVPVGVTTVSDGEQTYEIWYPAADATAGEAEDLIDFDAFLPDSFRAAVPEVDLPALASGGVRDAALRPGEAPYPVIVFSHGFGGMRVQSMTYASHLASRGYVVLAPDHPGRMMGDVLPCLFSPPLEGCDLSGMTGTDPALEDLGEAKGWLEDASESGFFAGALDLERLGLSGHSAGAGSTATLGEISEDYDALLLMAGGGELSREVPALYMGGSCDAFADEASLVAAAAAAGADSVQITGAGHLAFADLCSLGLGALAEAYLLGREDINETWVDGLLGLATDGCPDAAPQVPSCPAFLDLEVSDPIVAHYSTVFFDAALRGEGAGVEAGVFEEAAVSLAP